MCIDAKPVAEISTATRAENRDRAAVEEGESTMLIRLRYQELGGHVHCRLFTAPGPTMTFAKCGDVVFSSREWPDVRELLASRMIEVLPEEATAADQG